MPRRHIAAGAFFVQACKPALRGHAYARLTHRHIRYRPSPTAASVRFLHTTCWFLPQFFIARLSRQRSATLYSRDSLAASGKESAPRIVVPIKRDSPPSFPVRRIPDSLGEAACSPARCPSVLLRIPRSAGFSNEAIFVVPRNYSYPGNVRELENRVECSVLMARGFGPCLNTSLQS